MNKRINSRVFGISSGLFGNFKTTVYIDRLSTMKDIINMVISDLATILRAANLVNILNELKKRKFTNHDYNLNDVKMNPKKIFWITEVSNLKIQTHH
tara:strand:- start:2794 stop:3084 length:291 start_codon:yes stop_codon:yes gene_type:complete